MLLNAVTLAHEVIIRVPANNDTATHWVIIARMSDALARGEDPLDHWVPDLELGYAWTFYYQHLPHLAVVLLHRALFGLVDLFTLFGIVQWALMVTFPLTVLWSMRRLGSTLPAACLGAAAASLLSADLKYGLEYDSYIWRGWGLYTQLWGVHLSFIALACLHSWIVRGRGYAAAVVAAAALGLAHLLYVYMIALTVAIVLVFGMTRATVRGRVLRAVAVAVPAFVAVSYFWVPYLTTRAYQNVSPFLQREKYDSYGAGSVLRWLVSGELTDHGRAPVLLALLAIGLVAAAVVRRGLPALAAVLFALWLVLYFGRPTLGPLADLLPFHEGLLMHRFLGAVHLAAVLLIGVGGAVLWEVLRPHVTPQRTALAAGVLLLVLSPAMSERRAYYLQNAIWMRQTADAIARDRVGAEAVRAAKGLPPGRVYAGLRSNWGSGQNFGIPFNSVRVYDLLPFEGVPAVSAPYGSASLNSDLLFLFDDQRPAQYDVFDARYVIASGVVPPRSGLRPLVDLGSLVVWEVPEARGYADLVEQTGRVRAPSNLRLFEIERDWLASRAPDARQYLRIDYPARAEGTIDERRPACPSGTVETQRVDPSRIAVLARCATDSTLVFKVTYHPNWVVTVDGAPVETFMLSPSYVGIAFPAGAHSVVAEYRAAPIKAPLLVAGAIALLLTIALRRRVERALPARQEGASV